jgi:general L-amino acid transport system substrate-binding protein
MMSFLSSWHSALQAIVLSALMIGGSLGAAPAVAQQPAGGTLETIRARGSLICGVNAGLAGFAQPDSRGVWRGFDVDYCRAVAVALFNDPNRVRYVPTTAQNRFTALQSGEVDMLARNTTWTLSRDTSLGLDFAAISFYDGQGFMVKRSTNISHGRELDGATICVQPGTTHEQNLADWGRSNNIRFSAVLIERLEDTISAYAAGRCDAFSADVSGLAAIRTAQATPNDHVILDAVISKEPLGPVVRHGDQRFTDLIRWVHFGLLTSEELGITSENATQAATSDPRPDVQRLLGRTGDLGAMLSVDNAFMLNIIRTIGNYGEVFNRNLLPIGLQRGPNAPWTTTGGLQYAPPFR